jgi:hypothetical protein
MHPITRVSDDVVTLKLKVPSPDDDACRPGVFDEYGNAISLQSIRPGSEVDCIVHLANVWTMRGVTGLSMSVVQIKSHHAVVRCLITDTDDMDALNNSVPTGRQCMIVE